MEIGLPAGVVNFVPGSGRTIGDALVANPKTRFIAFTGSKEVGLHINELAAKTQPGQRWIKRVIAEMGGKDAIVVADDADLDAAADGVAAAAFGFQGQKCSACSRAIVDQRVYDAFVDKLVERVNKIVVGDPADAQTYVGPVINEGAMKPILGYIDKGVAEGGRLLTGGKRAAGDGFTIEPTVIADVAAEATIAQEEIFGPVLAVIKRERLRGRAGDRQQHGVRLDRRRVLARARPGSSARATSSSSATCTSTASAPARSSARTRSADSICPAPIRRPAATTTWRCLRRRRPFRRRSAAPATAALRASKSGAGEG